MKSIDQTVSPKNTMSGARAQSMVTRGKREPSMLEMANFFSERNRHIFYGDERVSFASGNDTRFSCGSLVGGQKAKSLDNLVECRVNNGLLIKRKAPHHLPSLSCEHQEFARLRGTREREKREKNRPESVVQKERLCQNKDKIKKQIPVASRPSLSPTMCSHQVDKDKIEDDLECAFEVKKASPPPKPASVPEKTPISLDQDKDSNRRVRPKQRGLSLQTFYRRLTQRGQIEPNQLEKVSRPYGRRATQIVEEKVVRIESQVPVRRKGVCVASDDFLKERTRTRVVFKRLGEEGKMTF